MANANTSLTVSRGMAGGKCGNWDFVANSDNQTTLSQVLMDAADAFDTRKNDMYNTIGTMGTYWKGEDYDLFQENAKKYDPALQDFSDGIRMFGTQFETIAANTETLANDLVTIVNNITSV